jgi:SAM-dependent methyltransferase
MTMMIAGPCATKRRDALTGRLFDAAIGMLDVLSVYVGDRLGLYRVLAERSSLTARQLAAATGTDERYIREWLEQQAATGILEAEEISAANGAAAEARRFGLPAGHAEVLTDQESLNCLTGLLRQVVGVSGPLPAVLDAYRTGAGVPEADFGPDTREGSAQMHSPLLLSLLGQHWLPSVPEIHDRLRADPPARVLDVGCGDGWSSIAIARAYPKTIVHGFDTDEASIAEARANAAAAGLTGRVSFALRDAAHPCLDECFDLVTVFETVHRLGRPALALAQMRELLTENGLVLVAGARVAETFTAPGDAVERLSYGLSALHTLPASRSDSDEAATGAVMRPSTLRRYARRAGFAAVEIAPIQHDLWRFYVLRP